MVVALTQQPSALWYFARASGFVSLLLLAATVALGLVLAMRWRSTLFPSFLSEGLHRYLTTVVYVFLAIHVLTLWLDPFAKFSLADVLVPFVSSYRTFWMGLGICAMEVSLALGLSIYIRPLIGYRAWRGLHYGTYATFPVALLHGLFTGTDTSTWWAVAIYAVSGLLVAGLAVARAADLLTPGHSLPGAEGSAGS
ncbi:MAG: iron reductase [Candidatus Dormiibacterota bacterium]